MAAAVPDPVTALDGPARRAEVLAQLVDRARRSPDTLAVVLVGSGARGFRDEWSDLDLLHVVETVDVDATVDRMEADVLVAHGAVFVTRYRHRPDVVVSCLLLPDGLGLDLGTWSIDVLFASAPHWHVLHARDAPVRAAVESAMRHRPPAPRPGPPQVSGDDPLWQAVAGLRVALLRGEVAPAAAIRDDLALRLPHAPGPAALHDAVERAARSRYGEGRAKVLMRLLDG